MHVLPCTPPPAPTHLGDPQGWGQGRAEQISCKRPPSPEWHTCPPPWERGGGGLTRVRGHKARHCLVRLGSLVRAKPVSG